MSANSELSDIFKCLGDTADPRHVTWISGGHGCTMHKLRQDTLRALDEAGYPIGVRKDSILVYDKTTLHGQQ